jgi:hypothetical protein
MQIMIYIAFILRRQRSEYHYGYKAHLALPSRHFNQIIIVSNPLSKYKMKSSQAL